MSEKNKGPFKKVYIVFVNYVRAEEACIVGDSEFTKEKTTRGHYKETEHGITCFIEDKDFREARLTCGMRRGE